MLYVDPLGLDAGQVDSTSARAWEDMGYQAGLNDNNKDRGNWAQGCAAGLADNWKKVDGSAMEGTHSPEYLAGLRDAGGPRSAHGCSRPCGGDGRDAGTDDRTHASSISGLARVAARSEWEDTTAWLDEQAEGKEEGAEEEAVRTSVRAVDVMQE